MRRSVAARVLLCAISESPHGVIDVALDGAHLYWTNVFTPRGRGRLAITGSRLTLRRNRRTSVELACQTRQLFGGYNCTGSVRIVTAHPIRYRGRTRRVTLAAADYWTITATRTVTLRLPKRKAALVRTNPRARTVRVIAQVVDAKNLTTVRQRMRLNVARSCRLSPARPRGSTSGARHDLRRRYTRSTVAPHAGSSTNKSAPDMALTGERRSVHRSARCCQPPRRRFFTVTAASPPSPRSGRLPWF
jgi:hypothetical protein